MLYVRELLRNRPPPHLLAPGISVIAAARELKRWQIGGAPVVEAGALVGFCSERDLVHGVMAEGLDPQHVRVADVMTRDLVTCTPDDRTGECEARLRARRCRHLPVLDRGRVVGCLSLRDFLQSELLELQAEADQLAAYVRGAAG